MEGKFEDWRGKEAISGKHGGIRAAFIACVVEILENMVFIANASNFVTYFMKSMHYSSAKAATTVTNFMGTSFLLTLFAGFIADSFLTRFTAFVLFCFIELSGLILLTIQAHDSKLQPNVGETPSSFQSLVLYVGLYGMALGVGGVKAALPAHGGDQLDSRKEKSISKFFDWYYYSLCLGGFFAVTVMVWVQENKGWSYSFDISAVVLAIAFCIFTAGFPLYRFKRPSGSPLTRLAKVLVSAARNRKKEMIQTPNSTEDNIHRNKFKFLDKAMIDDSISTIEVEETRTFLALLPIFLSTIAMNCCVGQLTTFTVEQGMHMNRKLTDSIEIHVPFLTAIPLIFVLVFVPLYEFFGHKIPGISHNRSSSFSLKRIGWGLALSSLSMAVSAIVETMRKREALLNGTEISVFWLVFQFVLLSFSELLALGGMLEFFYKEAPESMKSMSTSLGWCSTAMGFFLSSVLVEVTNAATGWLNGTHLNKSRLELFYLVLCVINTLNIFNYIFWAKRY